MRSGFAVAASLLLCAVPLAAQTPTITAVTSAAFLASPAQNGLVTIFGTGLSDALYLAGLPLPTQLGPTTVRVCPQGAADPTLCGAAVLIFASPDQINLVLEAVGPTSFYVSNGATLSAPFNVTVQSDAPSIFQEGYDCDYDPLHGDTSVCALSGTSAGALQVLRGAIVDLSGKLVDSENPAVVDEYYSIYFTGYGDGNSTYLRLNIPVDGQTNVSISSLTQPTYVGASSFAGLQQMNFQLTANLLGEPNDPFAPLLACSQQKIEMKVTITEREGSDTHGFQMPVSIQPGQIACH